MNPLIANIYGTHGGLEKVAAALPEGVTVEELPTNLSDLALILVDDGEGQDLQKTAAAHQDVLKQLIDFDIAGRHIAQAEFSEMEKAAAEGDASALETFFADMAPGAEGLEQKAALKEAIKAELASRGVR